MDAFSSKVQAVKALFAHTSSPEEVYKVIIDLGKHQTPLSPVEKTDDLLIPNCQSRTYLKTTVRENRLYFQIDSEALISAGLGQLLLMVYNGEPPETFFSNPPTYLKELGIYASLTPGRANGLASMFLRMRQEAAKILHTQEHS
jgi:cysteine desulfuration protein SufE